MSEFSKALDIACEMHADPGLLSRLRNLSNVVMNADNSWWLYTDLLELASTAIEDVLLIKGSDYDVRSEIIKGRRGEENCFLDECTDRLNALTYGVGLASYAYPEKSASGYDEFVLALIDLATDCIVWAAWTAIHHTDHTEGHRS